MHLCFSLFFCSNNLLYLLKIGFKTNSGGGNGNDNDNENMELQLLRNRESDRLIILNVGGKKYEVTMSFSIKVAKSQ